MPWEVEYTEQFGQWWEELSEELQDAVVARVELLMEQGPNLPYPRHQEFTSWSHARASGAERR